jgi:hypothetical protein
MMMMTDEKKRELILQFEAMEYGSDEEAAHGTADDLLIEFLREIGYEDVADAYEAARDRVGFWYA